MMVLPTRLMIGGCVERVCVHHMHHMIRSTAKSGSVLLSVTNVVGGVALTATRSVAPCNRRLRRTYETHVGRTHERAPEGHAGLSRLPRLPTIGYASVGNAQLEMPLLHPHLHA